MRGVGYISFLVVILGCVYKPIALGERDQIGFEFHQGLGGC